MEFQYCCVVPTPVWSSGTGGTESPGSDYFSCKGNFDKNSNDMTIKYKGYPRCM